MSKTINYNVDDILLNGKSIKQFVTENNPNLTKVIYENAANFQGKYQVFTESGSFTVPEGVTNIYITGRGGGGGGGNPATTYVESTSEADMPSSSNKSGGDGGSTSVSNLVILNGGGGGCTAAAMVYVSFKYEMGGNGGGTRPVYTLKTRSGNTGNSGGGTFGYSVGGTVNSTGSAKIRELLASRGMGGTGGTGTVSYSNATIKTYGGVGGTGGLIGRYLFSVTPKQVLPITIGAGGTSPMGSPGTPGFVVIEW